MNRGTRIGHHRTGEARSHLNRGPRHGPLPQAPRLGTVLRQPGDGGGTHNQGILSGIVRPFDPLRNWRRELKRARSGEGSVWLQFMGDSTTRGEAGSTWTNSVPAVVRQILTDEYGVPIDGPGLVAMHESTEDPEQIWGSEQHLSGIDATFVSVSGGFGSSTANAQVTFTTSYDARYFSIYHLRTLTGPYEFSWRIDGGSWVSSGSQSTGTSLVRETVVDLGTLGPHVIEVRVDVSLVVLWGFGTSTGKGGLQVHNAGDSGSNASDMPNDLNRSSAGAVAYPTLTIVRIGTNDWNNSRPLATVREDLRIKFELIRGTGHNGKNVRQPSDLMSCSMFPPQGGAVSRGPQYVEALRELTLAYGGYWEDTFFRWKSYPAALEATLMANSLHPTNDGYAEDARVIADILMAAEYTTPAPRYVPRRTG